MKPILLAVIALAISAVPAQAKKRAFCDTRPGATIVADGSHRVYVTVLPVKGDSDADVTTVYSCTNGSRKKSSRVERYKNTIDGAIRPASAKLSGRWLLLEVSEETGVSAGYALKLFDLRTHRKQASVYVDGGEPFTYALTSTGAFATFVFDDLTAFDAAGKRTLAGKTAGDLAAGGMHVYWTDNGAAGSAELGAAPKEAFSF